MSYGAAKIDSPCDPKNYAVLTSVEDFAEWIGHVINLIHESLDATTNT